MPEAQTEDAAEFIAELSCAALVTEAHDKLIYAAKNKDIKSVTEGLDLMIAAKDEAVSLGGALRTMREVAEENAAEAVQRWSRGSLAANEAWTFVFCHWQLVESVRWQAHLRDIIAKTNNGELPADTDIADELKSEWGGVDRQIVPAFLNSNGVDPQSFFDAVKDARRGAGIETVSEDDPLNDF